MAAETTTTIAAGASAEAKPAASGGDARGRAIIHPVVDVLCLGGLSLIVIPIAVMLPTSVTPALAAFMFIVADAVNHPHFAASYQIFYRGFGEKLFGRSLPPDMRVRYAVAGILVPVALIGFFAVATIRTDPQMLGWGANLMLFLVGWHYTKQGYGMLVVDSVFKRQFFTERQKTVLRWNAYTTWIFYWLGFNWWFSERDIWGLKAYSFPFPEEVVIAGGAAAGVTTLMVARVAWERLRPGGGGIPLGGGIAYGVSCYIWLAARLEPVALFLVPAFHSLQYLLVVTRFEVNRGAARAEAAGRDPHTAFRIGVLRFLWFFAVAVVLGLLGFWWIPGLLEARVAYDREAFGGFIFLFMFAIFINVHHYFMDNVIWRRENPEVSQNLFGVKPKA